MRFSLAAVVLACFATAALADGPADNLADKVRRIPKLGIEVPAEDRQALQQGLKEFESLIEPLRKNPKSAAYLPDVLVYHKAVHDALKYQELFDAKEIPVAHDLLKEGKERAEALARGETPWLDKTGPIVRGYISRIDGSVQPYGLVLPATLNRKSPHKLRLDFWFHGRGETLSELNFINDRRRNPGQFTPPDTIVLHPYGRYCNANKFAGEIDSFEALEAAQRDYRIDEDRISVRGFSMGGAACWQFAVHYADRWFAAAPGAGFSETPDFLKVFQKEELKPTWYEQKLWHWYDCTDYALNLANLPTVAYSGEKDSQKQAADVMAKALDQLPGLDRMELVHIIGPGTGHSYHPEAKAEINRRIDGLAEIGRDRLPRSVKLVTYTLRYNRMHWIHIEGMEEHWKKTVVRGSMSPDFDRITLHTENVDELRIRVDGRDWQGRRLQHIEVDGSPDGTVRGSIIRAPARRSDRSLDVTIHKGGGVWKLGKRPAGDPNQSLRKTPGLQGPIDDAFMDSFIFVRPTGKAANEMVGKWVEAELARAIEHWRRHFRGEARVKDDTAITEEDIKSSNLVLWGDPASNKLLGEIADDLPIQWTKDKIAAGKQGFSADDHALIAIYPNPKNPSRYVVLNSSFTFRDYAYLNNARQVAKLPDWAIVDLRTPPDALWPGKVVAADFFDESWKLKEASR